jgi:hypothetical protein
MLGREAPSFLRPLLGLNGDQDVKRCFEQSLALAHQTLGDKHVYTGLVHHELAVTLVQQKQYLEAELHFRACLSIAKDYGLDHPKTTIVLGNFTSLLQRRGKVPEAQKMLDEALAVRRKRYPAGHAGIADVKFLQAFLLPGEDPAGRRALLLREALTMYCQSPGVPHFADSCLDFLAKGLAAPRIVDLASELADAAAARKDGDRDRFLDLAMNALGRAWKKGFRDRERLRKDRKFDGLRQRPEFQKLIAETS